jgi:hypothetical protein
MELASGKMHSRLDAVSYHMAGGVEGKGEAYKGRRERGQHYMTQKHIIQRTHRTANGLAGV